MFIKHINKVILVIIAFFIGGIIIKADCECYYNSSNISADFKIDITNKKITNTGLIETNAFLDSYIDSEWTTERVIEEVLNLTCPNEIYVCRFSHKSCGRKGHCSTTTKYYYLFNGTLKGQLDTMEKTSIIPTSSNRYSYSYKDCVPVFVNNDKTTCEVSNPSYPCDVLESYIKEMDNNDCKLGEEGCDSNKINNYNKALQKANAYCSVTLQHSDYDINDCVEACLNYKEKYHLNFNSNQVCGFSERLILWIANIIRWVKYIIPVAVIVLGILDFMKAISADKEDEMKKAQQRFIRRLIAAALIFIAPFIIEFVLNKMGFAANGCGIINL